VLEYRKATFNNKKSYKLTFRKKRRLEILQKFYYQLHLILIVFSVRKRASSSLKPRNSRVFCDNFHPFFIKSQKHIKTQQNPNASTSPRQHSPKTIFISAPTLLWIKEINFEDSNPNPN
jgi:hypothetical protein